ncbi:hypothetical protein BDV3_006008 [Batrachochytrium dendrobatidis]|nr:hypothetical protein O5D80_005243 [Batrachochytrium dendrobatidis]
MEAAKNSQIGDNTLPLPSDSDLVKSLKKLLFILKSEDTTGFLSSKLDATRWPALESIKSNHVSFFTMTTRVLKGEYQSLSDFQTDFNLAISQVLKHFSPLDRIHQSALHLDDFGTRLINSIIAANTKATVDPATVTATTSTADVKRQKIALIQRGPDGTFYFSNAQLKAVTNALEGVKLNKVKIIPTSATPLSDVPCLGQSSKLAMKTRDQKAKKKSILGIRTAPVDFKDYGVFFSFAPMSDSSKASMSAAESTQIIKPGRRIECTYEAAPLDPPPLDSLPVFNGADLNSNAAVLPTLNPLEELILTDDEISRLDAPHLADLNMEDLTRLSPDIDWNTIICALSKGQADDAAINDHTPTEQISTAQLLTENAELIRKLADLQSIRYRDHIKVMRTKGTAGAGNMNRLERRYAQALKRNLLVLAKQTTPSNLATREMLADAWSIVHLYDPGFSGTLPHHKQHAYESNQIGRAAFAVDAASIPVTLQKDQFAHQQQLQQYHQRQFQILQRQAQLQQMQQTPTNSRNSHAKLVKQQLLQQQQQMQQMGLIAMGQGMTPQLKQQQQFQQSLQQQQLQLMMQAQQQFMQSPQNLQGRQAQLQLQLQAQAHAAAARLKTQ